VPQFKKHINSEGAVILYTGNPNLDKLESLSLGHGDIWHSALEQGYKNTFPEIVYQTAVFFWYGNDFSNLDESVSWRLNPNCFAVRKTVWDSLKGFDNEYENNQIKALDFAYNALRNSGAIPLHIKGLYTEDIKETVFISVKDRYVFYKKNFKFYHSAYMLWRKGIWRLNEWRALYYASRFATLRNNAHLVIPRELKPIEGNPTVSYIIPTMMRQDYTLNLLEDLKQQSYTVNQVIVVDATPKEMREESLYNPDDYPFKVKFVWQTSKGSCRARNEAINLCTGDYIVFGDDDIRIPTNFIENHLRLLQTYNADACNGLDIRADNEHQTLIDLDEKLKQLGMSRWKVGATQTFSNANSCVKRIHVALLKGNDINYDGGYGEDSDFGMSLTKMGVTVLHNPFSANLHLKPPQGGYRFWGNQSKILGKKRKEQPWELDTPVKFVRPVPSPTIMYQLYKQFSKQQRVEYRYIYFLKYLFKGSIILFPLKLIKLPYRLLQYKKSVFYAKKLIELGARTK
jgi:glycosyltransferase involved in cell wall biosynthesis